MGLCVSVNRNEYVSSSTTAKIVTINGDLREYDVPVLASQVLESESTSSSSSSSSSSYFLCNSDSLYYDDFIPAIESDEILQANQIYFVLPISKRQYRLSASDMAALAVKASVAIEKAAGKKNRRRRSGRISPVVTLNQANDNRIAAVNNRIGGEATNMMMQKGKLPNRTTPFKDTNGYSRSGSVRKLKRYTSGRAKLAVRSFRLRLSTIYEGSSFN
ncbi:hypothetical protein AtNW77_Chr1g0078461 [Arabidopsis thaliana]|jgi:hypothetical protein|uniref:Poly polymerase n=4 Tax=Arabidopsis TaxID=3701 RepID=Q9C9J8_ARATH|nr:poly polymerase [Arabidopsis thaliana]KAG7651920.1 hypothetical protein ISN45_At01g067350 [Arabidopsis thaliana x Arabidopsis arenosa]AAG51956.1 unknown protein; 83277-83927 [Arabidopsis thaliana]AAM64489.1 unknown [Arabidopsis thaliana]AAN15344.1 Unknown protein [Arabidopsis thaliana]AEE35863.1 poly polymerase [Arabidopsis thaliana]|eukprot:NP_565136.1 poly polymerase [Arabidopsis thaliana]